MNACPCTCTTTEVAEDLTVTLHHAAPREAAGCCKKVSAMMVTAQRPGINTELCRQRKMFLFYLELYSYLQKKKRMRVGMH